MVFVFCLLIFVCLKYFFDFILEIMYNIFVSIFYFRKENFYDKKNKQKKIVYNLYVFKFIFYEFDIFCIAR